jgi:hypothetical protein
LTVTRTTAQFAKAAKVFASINHQASAIAIAMVMFSTDLATSAAPQAIREGLIKTLPLHQALRHWTVTATSRKSGQAAEASASTDPQDSVTSTILAMFNTMQAASGAHEQLNLKRTASLPSFFYFAASSHGLPFTSRFLT